MTMAKLSEYKGKRCLTASGWLIYNDKVLFVKHALLGIWLSPGGHVEEHELPHLAAEREFFEAHRVASVLRVHAVDGVIHVIDVNGLLFVFYADYVFVEFPRGMQNAQEIAFWSCFKELFIAGSLEQVFTMSYIP